MIMPARWYAGGKGLDEFREKTLKDTSMKLIVDFFDSTDVFPNIDLSGGVCYFLRDNNYSGDCIITTHKMGNSNTLKRPLLSIGGSFIRFNEAVSIMTKISNDLENNFSKLVSIRKPFGIATNDIIEQSKQQDDIFIYAYPNNGFINQHKITNNRDWIELYKVYISYAYGERGDFPYFAIGKPFFGEPKTCCSETYLVINPSNESIIAENTMRYLKTKFLRFLVLLKKNTQHATSKVYSLVPIQDFTENSDIDWSKSVSEIDQQLYKKYGLDDTEIAFIESMIKPM